MTAETGALAWLGVLPPGWLLVIGALIVPLLPKNVSRGWMLVLPLVGLAQVWGPFGVDGESFMTTLFGLELTLVRADPLARLWSTIFHIAAFLSVLYALHVEDDVERVAGLAYAGAAIGALYAGDLLTLFVYWELTAITSVFIVWARRSEAGHAV